VSANGMGDGGPTALSRPAARRKFWGWGLEGQRLAASEIEQLGAVFTERLGIDVGRVHESPRVEELDLRAPRLAPPASLESAFSTDPYDRAAHTYGRSFRCSPARSAARRLSSTRPGS
jgi:alkyldihydroxyacetonephosphate synthase